MRKWGNEEMALSEPFPHFLLPGAAGLQARLHVAAGLGGDDAALLDAVGFGADDLQVHGAGVARLVQDPDVADQVDIAAAVRLVFRLARVLLAAFAVPD